MMPCDDSSSTAEEPGFLAPEQGHARGPLELGAPTSLPTPDCSEMCHGTNYPPRRDLPLHEMPVKAWIDVMVPADTEIYIERDRQEQDVFHLYLDNEKQLEILAFVKKADNLYTPFDNWGPTLEEKSWAEYWERNAMGAEEASEDSSDDEIRSMTMPLADFLREQGLLLGHESSEEEGNDLNGTAGLTPAGMLAFRAQLVSKHHADRDSTVSALNGLGDEGFDGFQQQNNLFGMMEGDHRLRLQYTKSFFSFSQETTKIKPWLPALVHDMQEVFLRAMVVREIKLEFAPPKNEDGGRRSRLSYRGSVRKTVQVQGDRVMVDSPIFGKHGKQPVSETPALMSLAEFLGWLSESLEDEKSHRAANGDEDAFSVKIRFSLFADRENFYPVCEKTPSKGLTYAVRKALKQNPKCWDSQKLQCWHSQYPLPNGQLTARNPVLAGGELWRQHGYNFGTDHGDKERFAVFVTEDTVEASGEVPAKIMFVFGPGEPCGMSQLMQYCRVGKIYSEGQTRPFFRLPAPQILLPDAVRMARGKGSRVIYAGHSYGAGVALYRSKQQEESDSVNSSPTSFPPIHVIATGALAMQPSSADLASSPSRKVWSLVLGGSDEEGATVGAATTSTKRLDIYGSSYGRYSGGPSLDEHWQLDDRHSWVDIPKDVNDPNSRASGRMDTRGTSKVGSWAWTWQRKGVFSVGRDRNEVAKLSEQKYENWMNKYHQFESYRAVLWAMAA